MKIIIYYHFVWNTDPFVLSNKYFITLELHSIFVTCWLLFIWIKLFCNDNLLNYLLIQLYGETVLFTKYNLI